MRQRVAGRIPAIVNEWSSVFGVADDRFGSTRRLQSGYHERPEIVFVQLRDLVKHGLPTRAVLSAIVSSEDVIRTAGALDEEACHLIQGHLCKDFGAKISRVQGFLSLHVPAAVEFLYGALAITLVEAPLEAMQRGITLNVTPYRNQLLPLAVAGVVMLPQFIGSHPILLRVA
jgi:hypothetical protein